MALGVLTVGALVRNLARGLAWTQALPVGYGLGWLLSYLVVPPGRAAEESVRRSVTSEATPFGCSLFYVV